MTTPELRAKAEGHQATAGKGDDIARRHRRPEPRHDRRRAPHLTQP